MSRDNRQSGRRLEVKGPGLGPNLPRLVEYFLPESYEISRDVLGHNICYFLGDGASSRWDKVQGEWGHVYRAQRQLSQAQIEDLQHLTRMERENPNEYYSRGPIPHRSASEAARGSSGDHFTDNPLLGNTNPYLPSGQGQFRVEAFVPPGTQTIVPGGRVWNNDQTGSAHLGRSNMAYGAGPQLPPYTVASNYPSGTNYRPNSAGLFADVSLGASRGPTNYVQGLPGSSGAEMTNQYSFTDDSREGYAESRTVQPLGTSMRYPQEYKATDYDTNLTLSGGNPATTNRQAQFSSNSRNSNTKFGNGPNISRSSATSRSGQQRIKEELDMAAITQTSGRTDSGEQFANTGESSDTDTRNPALRSRNDSGPNTTKGDRLCPRCGRRKPQCTCP